jgi:two-component system CheB/CheR fusion protein
MEYRERAIAIVMSGMLSDGTKGALRVHEYGATMLVQSPDEAKYESMPSSVIMNDHPQEILPVTALAQEVVRLIRAG